MTRQLSTRLLIPLAYMAALSLLSSIPGDLPADNPVGAAFQWVTPEWQNLLHIPLYAGLAIAWLWSLAIYQTRTGYWLVTAFVITAAWGAFDEVIQLHVPGRYASWTDVGLNIVGAGLAILYAMRRPLVSRST